MATDFSSVVSNATQVSNLVGSLGSGIAGLFRGAGFYKRLMEHQAKLQYEYGQKAAAADYARNKQMFDYEAAYNSPAANRARLAQANLLGASLFEGAAPGTGSMSPVDSGRPSVGLPNVPNNLAEAGEALSEGSLRAAQIANINADTKLKGGQTLLVHAQERLTGTKNILAGVQTIGEQDRNRILHAQAFITEATKGDSVQAIRLANEKADAEIRSIRINNAFSPAEKSALISNMQQSRVESVARCLEINSTINLQNAQAQLAVAYAAESLANKNLLVQQLRLASSIEEAQIQLFANQAGMSFDDKVISEVRSFIEELRMDRISQAIDNGDSDYISRLLEGSDRWQRVAPYVSMLTSLVSFGVGSFGKPSSSVTERYDSRGVHRGTTITTSK